MLRLAEKDARILAWDGWLELGDLGVTQSLTYLGGVLARVRGLAFSAHDLSRFKCWWSHDFKRGKRKQNLHASTPQSFLNVLASYLLMFHRRKQAIWPIPNQSPLIDFTFDGQRNSIIFQRGNAYWNRKKYCLQVNYHNFISSVWSHLGICKSLAEVQGPHHLWFMGRRIFYLWASIINNTLILLFVYIFSKTLLSYLVRIDSQKRNY